MYAAYFHISLGQSAAGDMVAFGTAQAKLRAEISRCGEGVGLRVGTLEEQDPALDHGTFVPLCFLREAGVDCPILRVSLLGFSPLDHYRLGSESHRRWTPWTAERCLWPVGACPTN